MFSPNRSAQVPAPSAAALQATERAPSGPNAIEAHASSVASANPKALKRERRAWRRARTRRYAG